MREMREREAEAMHGLEMVWQAQDEWMTPYRDAIGHNRAAQTSWGQRASGHGSEEPSEPSHVQDAIDAVIGAPECIRSLRTDLFRRLAPSQPTPP